MDFVELLKAWTSMSLRKMMVTGFLVLSVGAGFMYDKIDGRLIWVTQIETSNDFLKQELKKTPFDYVGVFRYDHELPFQVTEINMACTANNEICYQSKGYFLHEDLSRVTYHMQNLCELKYFPQGDSIYDMKVMATCPIIIDKRLMGYILAASMLNADSDDLTNFLRQTATKITNK